MKVLIKTKQFLGKLAITMGLRNPGSKHRHNWVVSGQLDSEHHEKNRQFQIDFLVSCGLSPEYELVEIGCGTLRGGIPIIDYLETGNYCGIDVRQNVLDEAYKELRDHALENKNPKLILFKDAKDIIKKEFDMAWSFQVLLHMSEARLTETFALISEYMKLNGSFYATVLIGSYKENEWQGFPVMSRPLKYYIEMGESAGMRLEEIGSLEKIGYGNYITEDAPSNVIMLRFFK